MKKFTFLFIVSHFCVFNSFGSHLVSTAIEHVVISSTTTTATIRLKVTSIFDTRGLLGPNSITTWFENDCDGSITSFTLPLDTTSLDIDFCFSDSTGNSSNNTFKVYQYIDTIQLNVNSCLMGTFYHTFNGVNPAIDNIINPGSQSMTTSSYMDFNVRKTNASVEIVPRNLVSVSCVDGYTTSNYSPYIDPDGDSINVEIVLGSSRTFNGSNYSSTDYAFNTDYSSSTPFSAGQTHSFNPKTGILSGNITKRQVSLITYKVSEYGFSNTLLRWYLIGQNVYSQFFLIHDSCGQFMPKFEMTGNTGASNGQNPGINAACGDTTLFVNLNNELNLNTLSADGSEFRIETNGGLSIPVMKASAISLAGGTTQIKLSLLQSLAGADTLLLRIKVGSDGNSLFSKCNLPISTHSVEVITTACAQVSVAEVDVQDFSIYPNPVNNITTIEGVNIFNQKFQLLTAQGKVVPFNLISKSLTHQKIDVTHLPNGFYILQYKSSDGLLRAKPIIKN